MEKTCYGDVTAFAQHTLGNGLKPDYTNIRTGVATGALYLLVRE